MKTTLLILAVLAFWNITLSQAQAPDPCDISSSASCCIPGSASCSCLIDESYTGEGFPEFLCCESEADCFMPGLGYCEYPPTSSLICSILKYHWHNTHILCKVICKQTAIDVQPTCRGCESDGDCLSGICDFTNPYYKSPLVPEADWGSTNSTLGICTDPLVRCSRYTNMV